MSFLGDLVDSIGTKRTSVAPTKTAEPQAVVQTKSTVRLPQPPTPIAPSQPNSLKRKAEDSDHRPVERLPKANAPPALSTKIDSRPSTPKLNDPKLSQTKAANRPQTPTNITAPKMPPKGSYADIMARAKQAQEQKSSKVGQIKHQATSKERISKVAERRREEQERLKNEKMKQIPQSSSRDRLIRKRSASPTKQRDQPSVSRAPRPPMHAPPGYKGTLGTQSKRSKDPVAGRAPKRSRQDEYLGTDEEDNSELDDYDDGYGSEGSSDMEAAYDELEGEETAALRAARLDDANELALEQQLKAEKEARRKRLAAMAKKAR